MAEKNSVLSSRSEAKSLLVLCFALALLCSGCATVTPENIDSLEKMNRPVYTFNQKVDEAVLKPVADTYVKITPQPVRTMIKNFFANVSYPNVILNDFLQGKGEQGLSDISRFVFNSIFGIVGLFDVATPMGIKANDEDFGQTLGVWGAGEGAYLVLPLLGPNTVRDSPDLAVSTVTNLLFYVSNAAVTVPLRVLNAIDARARASSAYKFINEAALDPYAFTREAYLQYRTNLIYDGRPPRPNLFDESEEEGNPPE